MDYFYTLPENISTDSVLIGGDEFSHLTHVMRKNVGDEIRVVDGLGMAYDVLLTELKKKTAHGTITKRYLNHNEPLIAVTLAVGILKNPSRFDFLVEKVTELGVREIIPLRTERTIPSHAKTDRWQKLALAAMKQSGRAYLPHVRELVWLEDVLSASTAFNIRLIAHEQPINNVPSVEQKKRQSILLLVGPEGGFSNEEVEKCVTAGCTPLYLGERRLRTETAAVVGVGLLTHGKIIS